MAPQLIHMLLVCNNIIGYKMYYNENYVDKYLDFLEIRNRYKKEKLKTYFNS